ncbi:NADP-dependent oxidoreductase domain-containing protein [Flagelloscypha sp. PMI_526]|nr:NADP-dependent oxidoreductase domain-containing protein [Flagelloscypha sp. PMI_526]
MSTTAKIGFTDIPAIGLGLMNLSHTYGPAGTDEERLEFLDSAFQSGATHWDTADVYGDTEDLVGKWFAKTGNRSKIFLATKFGFVTEPRMINGEPEYVKAAFAQSLSRLGVDQIDLFYAHRADKTVPIEKTVGAMAELVKEGKVKYLGLSEVSSSTLRRAHAVHPISAVQVEYNPFSLDIEREEIGLLETCRELGIAIVAYSPVGRGLLSGQITSPDDFDENDWRKTVPRYSEDNFPRIMKVTETLKSIGVKHGVSATQVDLAWLVAQSIPGCPIIPIPGTRKIKYVKENHNSTDVNLSKEDIEAIRKVAEEADKAAVGDRFPEGLKETLFVDTPSL